MIKLAKLYLFFFSCLKHKRWFSVFCPYNESQRNPVLFWTPLTINAWSKTAKTFSKISYSISQNKTSYEMIWGWENNDIINLWLNFNFKPLQCTVSPMHSHRNLKFGFYKATKLNKVTCSPFCQAWHRLNTHWRVQMALFIQYIWLNPDDFNSLWATQLIWSELSLRNHSIFCLDLQLKCSTLMRGKM